MGLLSPRMRRGLHVLEYRTTGGWRGGMRIGDGYTIPILLLTTTGRKTGRNHTVPLGYMEDGPQLSYCRVVRWGRQGPCVDSQPGQQPCGNHSDKAAANSGFGGASQSGRADSPMDEAGRKQPGVRRLPGKDFPRDSSDGTEAPELAARRRSRWGLFQTLVG